MSDIRPYYPPMDYKETLSNIMDVAARQYAKDENESLEAAIKEYKEQGGKVEDLCLYTMHGGYPMELRDLTKVILRIDKPAWEQIS